MRSAVEAIGLVKEYGGLRAVDGVSFQIHSGECFGFLGPNGAGKTTTMRMLYGRLRRSAGRLTVLGFDPSSDARSIRERVGVVPQDTNLDTELNVAENLTLHAGYFGIHGRAGRARAAELLEFVQLGGRGRDRIKQLSGGTTPVSPGEIVAGNVLWQATQSLVYGLVFTALLVVLGLTHSLWIALVPLLAVAGAPLFGLPAMAWGAWAGGFGRINLFYYTEAVVAPMFFFSGAFFPVGSLPANLQAAIWVMPLYHVVNISRALADGSLHDVLLVDIAYCLCLTAVFAALVVRLFRRQLTT